MTAAWRRGDVVLTVVLLAVFAGGYLLTLAWPFRTALFPRMVSAVGLVVAVVHLAVIVLGRRRATAADADAAAVPSDGTHAVPGDVAQTVDHSVEYVFASAGGRAWGAALAWIGGFFASLWLLGAIPTVPIFALLYLRIAGGVSWRAAVAYAAGAGIAVWLLLGRLLSVPMPTGVL